MKSVFGKVVVSIILVFGLVAGSCNTSSRSEEIRVKESDDGSKEMRMEKRVENDSVSFEREKTIRTDEDGSTEVRVKTDVERTDPDPE